MNSYHGDADSGFGAGLGGFVIAQNKANGRPRGGIGSNARIENARIGNDVVISPAGKPENVDHPLYFIRDGIVIIPKNGFVPHGTVI